MNGRFYAGAWNESGGDEFDAWGHSVWYFEVDDGGWPLRRVEVYDAGPILRYGPEHKDDQYGGLGHANRNDPDEDWSQFAITRDVFERV